MTVAELRKNGKKLGERDFHGNLYTTAYAGTREYYLLDGFVWVIETHTNQLEYTGENGVSHWGYYGELMADEDSRRELESLKGESNE